jgi:hypothetical protein
MHIVDVLEELLEGGLMARVRQEDGLALLNLWDDASASDEEVLLQLAEELVELGLRDVQHEIARDLRSQEAAARKDARWRQAYVR